MTDSDTTESGEVIWYTIQGQRLSGAPTEPGIYLRVEGAHAVKHLIR